MKIIVYHYLFSRTGKINNHFFQEKKNEKMWICYNRYNILKNISIYTDISYTYISIYRTQYIDISNAIYRYFRYLVAIPTQTHLILFNVSHTHFLQQQGKNLSSSTPHPNQFYKFKLRLYCSSVRRWNFSLDPYK